jgi:hypothetical protein
MKKVFLKVLLATCIVAVGSPAFAELFQNGGFETGTLSGWTVDYGRRNQGAESVDWGSTGGADANPAGLIGFNGKVVSDPIYGTRTDNGNLPVGQTSTILPYVGSYMALLNDSNGNRHATRLTQQSSAITAQDITDNTKIYVDWGAALVEPTNNNTAHSPSDYPFFEIDILKNGAKIDTFKINSHNAAGSGWANIGTMNWDNNSGIIYYEDGQFVYDLVNGGFLAGDKITVDMFVADCGLGGHGAYAFLDGIGTVQPPPPHGVPEPGTLLLVGLGLVGVAGIKRRFRS